MINFASGESRPDHPQDPWSQVLEMVEWASALAEREVLFEAGTQQHLPRYIHKRPLCSTGKTSVSFAPSQVQAH